MNGPQHYAAADEWLTIAEDFYTKDKYADGGLAAQIAAVHATLAQAAAVAELEAFGDPPGTGRTSKRSTAWTEVMS